MEDSKDTGIVIGCGKLKGPQFKELFKGVGPIKVADDGNTLARINLQRQEGIVTYQNSELAKKAIATLNGKLLEGENIEVVSAEQYFSDKTHRNGKSRRGRGKGGSGFFSFFRVQDGQPSEPGSNGRIGEGEKAGLDFSEGFLEGVVKGEGRGSDQRSG
ncbi:hypothetical protein DPMN_075562 [Dreissena polymorpha]|uniref:RRM domain-containing protein n=1 Tax=Dreissena polymorpha TaxID=45954 RepID=A0A9D3YKK2_DREPO|nr:hypothetical protein DPMN_075562 [Dreissena polymorpha]